ncbi:MAG: hypothetical protein P3W97_000035 [Tepidimonas sp.]|uniref:PhaM family polyhydroxyalkanoate granule multifunctional regulatory protein n=1 Tax=Tepidimonas sp. TaxID=2002775 RepID=UPI00259F9C5E|nr:PhaM family polyhydroxyalkanoate granule multifunctional regulatory protein [Tepidimonas sp.]MDM7455687.1 hypothetical protein [Tepidimonas sp.]
MTSPNFGPFQAAFAPYAQYIPGFAFLQGLAGNGPAADMPSMSQWVAPVFDVNELEQRIRDLKAVHFWLEQNARALQATIQALEVQKMTLVALKGMNVSLNEMAQAFAGSGAQASPGTEARAASAGSPSASDAPANGPAVAPGVDPLRWWRSLTEQFQTIAANTLQEMAQHSPTPSAPPSPPVPPTSRPVRAAQPIQAPTDGSATSKRRPGPQAAAAGGATPVPAAAARTPRGRTAAPNPRTAPSRGPRG